MLNLDNASRFGDYFSSFRAPSACLLGQLTGDGGKGWGASSCSVAALMPSRWRFQGDTWDRRTWTMRQGVTLNLDVPTVYPPRSPSPVLSHRSPLIRLQKLVSLFITWSIPPRYSVNLFTHWLSRLPILSPSGHHKCIMDVRQNVMVQTVFPPI